MTVSLLITGCTLDQPHPPPEAFCGEDVDGLHAPLFSGKDEISESRVHHSETPDGARGPVQFCTLSKGSDVLIEAGTSFTAPGRTTKETLAVYTASGPEPEGDGREVPSSVEVRVWPRVAYALIPCTDSLDRDLLIAVATPRSDNEETLADLIIPFTRTSLDHWVGSCFDEVPDI